MLQILDIIYEIVEKIKCFYAKGKKKKKKDLKLCFVNADMKTS